MKVVEVYKLKVGDVIKDLNQEDVLNTRRRAVVTRVAQFDGDSARKGTYSVDTRTIDTRRGQTTGGGFVFNARYKVVRVRPAA